MTSDELVKGKIDPKKIFKRISTEKQESEDKIETMSIYMKSIKDILNKYTHTNIDGLMLLFMEDHQTYETMHFNKLVVRFLIMMIEILFIPMVNYL